MVRNPLYRITQNVFVPIGAAVEALCKGLGIEVPAGRLLAGGLDRLYRPHGIRYRGFLFFTTLLNPDLLAAAYHALEVEVVLVVAAAHILAKSPVEGQLPDLRAFETLLCTADLGAAYGVREANSQDRCRQKDVELHLALDVQQGICT